MIRELSASNCKVYAMKALSSEGAGVVGFSPDKGGTALYRLAQGTGGKYYGNMNSYEESFEDIQKVTGAYYVLGYYIDEKYDGKFHSIKKIRYPITTDIREDIRTAPAATSFTIRAIG